MELTTEFSSLYIIGCAVLAGLYTFLLYGKNSQNKDLPKWTIQLLGLFRFLTVFILAALLLNPLLQRWITKTDPPIIVIAQDVSSSVINNEDSTFYKTDYLTQLNSVTKRLSENYEVVRMNFAETILENDSLAGFNGKQTDLGNVFDEIESRYASDNVAALVLATDGLFNVGANPLYYNFHQVYPIYTIGLGDTVQKSDLSIAEILTNDIVYLGNKFPVEISVNSDLLKGEKAELKVFNGGKLLAKRVLKITEDHQFFKEEFSFIAEKEGTQRYVVKLTQFENELNTINNTEQVLIDVIDNRDRVLIIASAPHPDIAVIRGSLLQKDGLEVEVTYIEQLTQNLDEYHLIIAHGFFDNRFNGMWSKVWESKVPLWCILNGNVRLGDMMDLNPEFVAQGTTQKVNRISPNLNKSFSAFTFSQKTKNFIADVPPLHVPYGEIESFNGSQTLLYQKLGAVETNFPLMYFQNRNKIKTAWLFGEGLWQWKLFNYQRDNNHDSFNEIIGKTVQYLSVKEDKSRFRVKVAKRFNENQNIKLTAEFYNESYELVNTNLAKLTLTNQEGDQFKYDFNAVLSTYSIDIGRLKPGVYIYEAKIVDGLKSFTKKGSFIVKPVNIEWSGRVPNFTLLQKLSLNTGAKFFLPANLGELEMVFSDQSKFPSISYTSETKYSLLHEKWIFVLIISLLTLEWFIRKYKGRL